MRMIDANEAIKIINHAAEVCNSGFTRNILELVAVGVENLKTIEAEPVKHGRWEHLGGDEWYCTNCDEVISTEGSWDKPTYKHCHECGARMDGE